MAKPRVPIEIDEKTGVWSTDDLPMLYLPRHFFNNLHLDVEEALGQEKYAQMLYKSGYKSAWYWCEQESKTHNISGVKVFEHYLQRLSQRGWGQFSFIDQSLDLGNATILVDNSAFVLHKQQFNIKSEHPSCYMFSGWWAGAADWVAQNQNWGIRFQSSEHMCVSCGAEHCHFSITPV